MTSHLALLPLSIAPDHPAFAGHFPGHPIVPGVVLLDEALQCLASAEGLEVVSLNVGVAKFLLPVTPGMSVGLAFKQSVPGRYALEVWASDADATAAPRLAATATVSVSVQGPASADEARG